MKIHNLTEVHSQLKSTKLDNFQLLRLEQLLNRKKHTNIQSSDSTQQTIISQTQISKNKSKKFYETNIDPLYYLVNGPIVIFPKHSLSTLSLSHFVEYYRMFPCLNWSKYPELERLIRSKLTDREQRDLLYFEKFNHERRNFVNELYAKYFSLLNGELEKNSLIKILKNENYKLGFNEYYKIAWVVVKYFGMLWFIKYLWRMIIFAFK